MGLVGGSTSVILSVCHLSDVWFIVKLIPSRWMSKKVKATGDKSEKNEGNKRHQPAHTETFCGKKLLAAK